MDEVASSSSEGQEIGQLNCKGRKNEEWYNRQALTVDQHVGGSFLGPLGLPGMDG